MRVFSTLLFVAPKVGTREGVGNFFFLCGPPPTLVGGKVRPQVGPLTIGPEGVGMCLSLFCNKKNLLTLSYIED
jgi:hypothetical protein